MDGLSGAVKTSAGAWREIYFQAGPAEPIPVEAYSFEVLAPSEVDSLVAEILRDAKIASTKDRRALAQRLDAWVCAWKMQFERYGHRRNGELAYRELILNLEEEMVPELESDLPPSGDGRHALEILRSVLSTGPVARTHGPVARNWSVKVRHRRGSRNDAEPFGCPVFRKPLVIVSAPRSGSTLLFETLVQCPNLWTIGTESHAVIEDIPALHPAAKDFHSNRLTADDATPTVVESLREGFARRLQDRTGRPYVELPAGQRPNSVRFLEKTPKNALRIPFLKAVFPDAQFIYLYREPRETISSMVEAWRARSFVSYRRLPGWPYRDWCFLLVPGWRSLKDCSLLEIATYQWQTAHEHILADLHDLPRSAWHCVDYAELVREPKRIIREIAEFGEFEWDQRLEQMVSGSLPLSSRTLSAPASDKWRKYASEFAGLLPGLQPDP